MREATIIIDGRQLSTAQSMAVRVAIGHMIIDMLDPLALGEDEHGLAMTKAYKENLLSIQNIILAECNRK